MKDFLYRTLEAIFMFFLVLGGITGMFGLFGGVMWAASTIWQILGGAETGSFLFGLVACLSLIPALSAFYDPPGIFKDDYE